MNHSHKICAFRYFFLVILIFAISIGLSGCGYPRIVMKQVVKSDLTQRYGEEFVIDTIYREGAAYHVICHLKDDPTVIFECLYGDYGELGYDKYLGALVSREDSLFLSEQISSELGDIYISGIPSFSIYDSETDLSICELYKEGGEWSEKIYEEKDVELLIFYVLINESTESFIDNPYDEYECFKRAVDELVKKYIDKNNQSIRVSFFVYFLNDVDFDYSIDYLQSHIRLDSYYSQRINEANNYIVMEMGTQTANATQDLWLTREQYIELRKEIK